MAWDICEILPNFADVYHVITHKPRLMTREEESLILSVVQGKDVSEVMSLLMKHGNRYSRRILKFFRWFCKWAPVTIMCFHAFGMWEFSKHPREMFFLYEGNTACYVFIYFMVYLLPIVIILASRFFFLCWKYRIPFFYYFGVNALHVVYGSLFTTNEMVMPHFALMGMIACMYLYGMADWVLKNTRIGRKIFS